MVNIEVIICLHMLGVECVVVMMVIMFVAMVTVVVGVTIMGVYIRVHPAVVHVMYVVDEKRVEREAAGKVWVDASDA